MRSPLSLMRVVLLLVALSVAAGCAGADSRRAPAMEERSPVAAIQDPRLGQPGVDADARLARMARLGASAVRIDLRWDLVAPRRPADPRDPGDGAYRWAPYDRVVEAAGRHGIELLMTVWGTPAWAADPSVPRSGRFPARATRPRDPADYGHFGAAAALRYAPRGVRLWEAWNEPNLPLFLRPQYRRGAGGWEPSSPRDYAALLTAFHAAVTAVDPGARIGGGVTAPVGDGCPASCPDAADDRVPPLVFLDGLTQEGGRPPMDAYSHHPYPTSRPRATTPPDVAYIDLYNLGRLERRLDDGYLADRPVWLSEVGVATGAVPEYPFHVGERAQAQMLLDAYRRARADPRVEMTVWYLLQDQPTWRSGLLREDGTAKPAARAFSLPAVVAGASAVSAGEPVPVVGQVRPARGSTEVVVERARGAGWAPVDRLTTADDGSFRFTLRPRESGRYRVRWHGAPRGAPPAGRTSVPFRVKVEP